VLSDLKLACVALLFSIAAGSHFSIESRTLSPVSPAEKGVNLILNQRIVAEGKVVFSSRTVPPDGSVFFNHREYTMDGTPVSTWQEGFWSNRWNRFETRYQRKGAEQRINETINKTDLPDSTFRNPTLLWFWRTRPKMNESVVVTWMKGLAPRPSPL
jgi:hypothetical protein